MCQRQHPSRCFSFLQCPRYPIVVIVGRIIFVWPNRIADKITHFSSRGGKAKVKEPHLPWLSEEPAYRGRSLKWAVQKGKLHCKYRLKTSLFLFSTMSTNIQRALLERKCYGAAINPYRPLGSNNFGNVLRFGMRGRPPHPQVQDSY